MEQRSANTSAAPEILIEAIHGSLELKGWDENEVQAKSASGGGLSLEEEHDSVRISCQGDLVLRVPTGASVRIDTVHGDARIKLLEDPLAIGAVHGSLNVRSTGPVDIEAVQGDLQARDVAGDLRVGTVQGTASIRAVEGAFSAGRVQGDLSLREVDGEIQASADGSARVRLRSLPGGSYRIEAGGDLHCRIPDDASAAVQLHSGAETLVLDLPGQRASLRQAEHNLTLGSGAAQGSNAVELKLSAGGVLSLSARELEWDEAEGYRSANFEPEFGAGFGGVSGGASAEFTERLTRQIDEQVHTQMGRLSEQMARLSEMMGRAGLSEQEAEQVMRRAQQNAEEATARAQEKIARAQERLARKMEASARKAEQRSRTAERRSGGWRGAWSFEWPGAPRPPAPPAPGGQNEPVSDEERLMILRMLEQKKITLEEAEKLLSALEGKAKSG